MLLALGTGGIRRHLLDVMTPEEFAALGSAMAKVRDAALGIHQAVVAEACAEAELEEALDQELARADS